MLGLLLHFRVPPQRSVLTVITLGNQSISRGPQWSRNNASITLPVLVWHDYFQSGEGQRSFHCWLMHLVPGWQCKHHDFYPPTIWSKNLSPSPSYCIRCSKQTPIRVAFFSSFQLFGTRNAETFQYSRTCMMWWCTYSTLMPKCHTMINLHHLILLGTCLGPKRGFENWGMPSPQCCSYPLWISFTRHCCTLQRVIAIHTLH